MTRYLAALALLVAVSAVRAEPRETDAVLLARICVSEAGFSAHETGDCAAIHYAILGTASERGTSVRASARAHSPRATGARQTTDRRLAWVSQLGEAGTQPAAWPGPPHAPWVAFRSRWLDVLERSRELATWTLDTHEEHSACAMPPVTWAARWHPPSRGLVEVDCGDTANAFYVRASR